MTTRGNFSQLLAPGLMALSFDVLQPYEEEYSTYCALDTTTRAYEEYQALAGLGDVYKKLEGSPIEYDDPIQGGSKRIIAETFGLGWKHTLEMLADDQYGKIRECPAQLMQSMRHKMESVAAAPLNLAFTTHKTVDGESFIDTAHPLLGGGTQSNQHATNMDLSETALQDFKVMADNYVNERGQPRKLRISDLWIPSELQWIAARILKSELEPGTGNNAINTVKGMVTPHILTYLTSTSAYYLSCKGTNYLKFFTRMKPIMESADDFDTKGTKHSIIARFAAGAWRYEGWFGSTGLGS